LIHSSAFGEDWPSYGHDAGRTGSTAESLRLPLHVQWTYRPTHPPAPAWPLPAERDYLGRRQHLGDYVNLLDFDHAFHPVIAGGRVVFGSSSEHTLTCLDAATGKAAWTFFTEGPVRMAPTLANGRVYAGSDDGFLYCLDAKTGELVWKRRIAPEDSRLPGNEQMISRWPLRSGVVIRDGLAIVAAGVFPHRLGCFLVAVDAKTGQEAWRLPLNQIAQGYLVSTPRTLAVPGGEGYAQSYDPKTGKLLGKVAAGRGTTGVAIGDLLAWGPGLRGKSLALVRADATGKAVGSLAALRVAASPSQIFGVTKTKKLFAKGRASQRLSQAHAEKKALTARLAALTKIANDKEKPDEEITAAQREMGSVREAMVRADARIVAAGKAAKNAAPAWEGECEETRALIHAGEHVFVTGRWSVVAYRARNGEPVWRGNLEDKAVGMAAAGGRLFVATDKGAIVCFGPDKCEKPPTVRQERAELKMPDERRTLCERAVKVMKEGTPFEKGYCLDLGCGDGSLAAAIAKQTGMTVIAVQPDAKKAAAARDRLRRAGLYGARVVVHEVPLDKLPYPPFVFNLIVSQRTLTTGELPPDAKAVRRVLRPSGGTLWLGQIGTVSDGLTKEKMTAWLKSGGLAKAVVTDAMGLWAVLRREPIPGGGAWTHQYADPANTACSDDTALKRPVEMQWYGRPGPRRMFDRHAMAHSPLCFDGHLFTLAEGLLIAQDAYNGTIRWSAELGMLRPRINIPRDSGYMASNGRNVYIAAAEKCYVLPVKTGKRRRSFFVPKLKDGTQMQWGYVAVADGTLFGSGVRPGRFYRRGRGPHHDKVTGKVCSDFLFAYGARSRQLLWMYGGVVVNSSITVADGRVYFVENRQPEVIKGKDRIISEQGEMRVVALDAQTGKKVWETPVTYKGPGAALFGQYGDGLYVAVRGVLWGRHHVQQDVYAYDGKTGKLVWSTTLKTGHGHHGAHRRKGMIVGDLFVQDPVGLELKTGKQLWQMKVRTKCGNLSASAHYLMGRYWHHAMLSLKDLAAGNQESAVDRLTSVSRPGCWISTISAGGMVLAPEASTGCACYFPSHASMGFISKEEGEK
jgi:outer membrane protein assembly factor BamB